MTVSDPLLPILHEVRLDSRPSLTPPVDLCGPSEPGPFECPVRNESVKSGCWGRWARRGEL